MAAKNTRKRSFIREESKEMERLKVLGDLLRIEDQALLEIQERKHKLESELQRNKTLQDLYWEDNQNFVGAIRRLQIIDDISEKAINRFVEDYIIPERVEINCLHCGIEIQHRVSTYKQWKDIKYQYTRRKRGYEDKKNNQYFNFWCSRCLKAEKKQIEFLKELHYKDRQAYYETDHWKEVRQVLKKERESKCEHDEYGECSGPLQAHHKTYNYIGEELEHLDSLGLLCRRHHSELYGKEEWRR